MSDRPPAPRPINAERRDLVVTELCEHFAADHLELDELERRLEVADRAETDVELDALLRDLPALAEAPPPKLARVRPAKRGWALAVMGGSTRKGEWTPPRQLNAVAVMGGVELDFRHARMAPGTTHVTAVAVCGGVTLILPPGLPVEVRGLGILGAVDHVEQASEPAHPDTPTLKVTALACMGGVDVTTPPLTEEERGDETRESRRRRRRLRRGDV